MKLPILYLSPEALAKIDELLANPPEPSISLKDAAARYNLRISLNDISKHETNKDK